MPTTDTAPTLRSIPTADGIADLVRRRYDLDVAACVLVRSFVNEVYEVRTPGRRFVLKLYHHGGWTVDEVGWEAELVDHLVANGIPVAPVVVDDIRSGGRPTCCTGGGPPVPDVGVRRGPQAPEAVR